LPHFAAEVAEIAAAARQSARQKTIANKEHRVDALIDRERRMKQVIEERADWYETNKPGVPGGKSGLLVSSIKFVKVYEVDQKLVERKLARWKPKVGDQVEVIDEGLAKLRQIVPDAPPNHHGIIEEFQENGDLLILFDDSKSSAPYPKELVRPRGPQWEPVVYPTREVVPVDEHAVDTALLREMRETEKQLAIELGEWTEKRQNSGTTSSLDLSQLNDEQLNEYERHLDAGIEPERAYLLARKGKASA
jgi:hypothetical protein